MKSTFINGPNGRYRIKYYQERNKDGDFLAVFPDEKYYGATGIVCTALATAVGGQKDSVCTTGVSRQYLANKCRRVSRESVWPSLVERAESND